MNRPQVYICPPHLELPSHLSPHPIPLGCARALALNSLLRVLNLHWSSVLHVMMYMFQCYSLRSSHTYLLPLSGHRSASTAQKYMSVIYLPSHVGKGHASTMLIYVHVYSQLEVGRKYSFKGKR